MGPRGALAAGTPTRAAAGSEGGDPTAVAAAADRLASARAPIIVAGDGVGYADAWAELQTLAELLGAHVYSETLSSMMNYPNSSPEWQGELPGLQLKVQEVFAD